MPNKIDALIAKVQSGEAITEINLSGESLSGNLANFQKLINLLNLLETPPIRISAKSIILSGMDISSEHIQSVQKLISYFNLDRQIEVLDLSYNQLNLFDIHSLWNLPNHPVSQELQQLKSLDLSFNKIEDEYVANGISLDFFNWFDSFTVYNTSFISSIERLNFSYNCISKLKTVANIINRLSWGVNENRKQLLRLKLLNFRGNTITDVSGINEDALIKHLKTYLNNFPSKPLKFIDFTDCGQEILPYVSRIKDVLGITPEFLNRFLFNSVRIGNLEDVKDALTYGADPNAKDENGRTALELSQEFKKNSVTQFLLDFNPQPYSLARLVSAIKENKIANLNLSNEIILESFIKSELQGHTDIIYAFTMLPNGWLVSGGQDQTIHIWNLTTSQAITLKLDSCVLSLATPTANLLAVGTSNKGIQIWDIHTQKYVKTLGDENASCYSLTILPDGKLASGHFDGEIYIWDINNKQSIRQLYGHKTSVTSLATLSDGKLASASGDGTIRIWNPGTGGCLKILLGHTQGSNLNSLVALPNGQLASGSVDKTILIWEPEHGTLLKTLQGHTAAVWSLAVGSNNTLISGGHDRKLIFWNIETGECLNMIELDGLESIAAITVLSDNRIAIGRGQGGMPNHSWGIRLMSINPRPINQGEIQTILNAINNNHSIKNLDLSNIQLNKNHIDTLMKIVNHQSANSFTSLNLRNTGIKEENIKNIRALFKGNLHVDNFFESENINNTVHVAPSIYPSLSSTVNPTKTNLIDFKPENDEISKQQLFQKYYQEGQEYEKNLEFDAAFKSYGEALTYALTVDEKAMIYNRCGVSLLCQHQENEADKYFDQALKLIPDYLEAKLNKERWLPFELNNQYSSSSLYQMCQEKALICPDIHLLDIRLLKPALLKPTREADNNDLPFNILYLYLIYIITIGLIIRAMKQLLNNRNNGNNHNHDNNDNNSNNESIYTNVSNSDLQNVNHFMDDQGNLIELGGIPDHSLTTSYEIGRGGFGIVNKGTYNTVHVAIKKLNYQNLSQSAVEDFKQELSIMSKLNSPYVVKLVGACLEPPHYSLVMEYLPNGDLHDFLLKSEEISWKVRYQIAIDIGQGIKYLHGQEPAIIHGDLKSLNVLLDTDYRAKIADFGLAKVKIASSVSTQLGGKQGISVRWEAPEVLFSEGNERKKSKASDMYSYGTILWELGARKLPYPEQSNNQVFASKFQELQQGISDEKAREIITQDTPPAMAKLIARCWKERNQRPVIADVVKIIEAEKRLQY